MNCYVKSKVIFFNSFIRCNILNDEYHNPFMLYYCYIRMNNVLEIDYSIHNASLFTTPYYQLIYSMIQNVLHLPDFPAISNKKLYRFLIPNEPTYAETQYPTFNWKRIWDNFNSTIANPYDKEIIFKHLHLCLATNERLAMMNLATSSICTNCPSNRDHTPVHMFYQCESIKPLFLWLLRILLYLCNFKPTSKIRFLYYDNFYGNFYQKSICNIFIYVYIITIWKTRKEILRIGILKNKIIFKVVEHLEFLKHIPNHKLERLFERTSSIDFENLIQI